uniref:Rab-GAP TBC domain-containing protein n=1 Tax=Globisporangium ultimum (strain ATCC 200006 / CBS 805.95 / DAOM BR144) TaxID=431595 RepID=K3WL35_GLOUD
MKKPQHLKSLHVAVVPPEAATDSEAHNATVKKMEAEHDDEMSAMTTMVVTSPVAFPRLPIDRYGFLISDKRYNRGTPENSQKTAVWLENRRTQKWVKMIGKQLEDWEICQLKNAAMLKKRIRKGIPEALRGRVWCHLAGSTQMVINNPGVYHEFLQSKHAPCEETIARDIGRTFPKHYLFNERTSLGQCALMNVLKVYSLHDPEVGYCQGMGFLSAMFLSYMPEEQSFWHLVACLNHKRYDLANLYRPRMPKVPELIFIFEKLMEQLMPQIAKHLESEGLHPTMYLTQWFITLFTYNFPFEFVTRVWDMFLYEGWKIIFRVALALMKISQSEVAFAHD